MVTTLKSFKIFNLGGSYCRNAEKPCVPLEDLTFCQNLEEFYGYLHSHDLETLATLPNLKKLILFELDSIDDLEDLLSDMNLSKLKYLSLHETKNCEELGNHQFPALERLCIPHMSKDSMIQLIKNCPNLKSIQFPSGNYNYNIPDAIFYKIFKHKNILFIFDKVNRKNDEEITTQKLFEDYVMEQDLQEFRRYKIMKEDFKEWCRNNPGYGY